MSSSSTAQTEEWASTGIADPWAVLNVDPSASASTVKKAFAALSKLHHPDKNPCKDDSSQQKSHQKMQQLNLAYKEIKIRLGVGAAGGVLGEGAAPGGEQGAAGAGAPPEDTSATWGAKGSGYGGLGGKNGGRKGGQNKGKGKRNEGGQAGPGPAPNGHGFSGAAAPGGMVSGGMNHGVQGGHGLTGSHGVQVQGHGLRHPRETVPDLFGGFFEVPAAGPAGREASAGEGRYTGAARILKRPPPMEAFGATSFADLSKNSSSKRGSEKKAFGEKPPAKRPKRTDQLLQRGGGDKWGGENSSTKLLPWDKEQQQQLEHNRSGGPPPDLEDGPTPLEPGPMPMPGPSPQDQHEAAPTQEELLPEGDEEQDDNIAINGGNTHHPARATSSSSQPNTGPQPPRRQTDLLPAEKEAIRRHDFILSLCTSLCELRARLQKSRFVLVPEDWSVAGALVIPPSSAPPRGRSRRKTSIYSCRSASSASDNSSCGEAARPVEEKRDPEAYYGRPNVRNNCGELVQLEKQHIKVYESRSKRDKTLLEDVSCGRTLVNGIFLDPPVLEGDCGLTYSLLGEGDCVTLLGRRAGGSCGDLLHDEDELLHEEDHCEHSCRVSLRVKQLRPLCEAPKTTVDGGRRPSPAVEDLPGRSSEAVLLAAAVLLEEVSAGDGEGVRPAAPTSTNMSRSSSASAGNGTKQETPPPEGGTSMALLPSSPPEVGDHELQARGERLSDHSNRAESDVADSDVADSDEEEEDPEERAQREQEALEAALRAAFHAVGSIDENFGSAREEVRYAVAGELQMWEAEKEHLPAHAVAMAESVLRGWSGEEMVLGAGGDDHAGVEVHVAEEGVGKEGRKGEDELGEKEGVGLGEGGGDGEQQLLG